MRLGGGHVLYYDLGFLRIVMGRHPIRPANYKSAGVGGCTLYGHSVQALVFLKFIRFLALLVHNSDMSVDSVTCPLTQ